MVIKRWSNRQEMKARKRVKRLPQSLFLYFIFSSLAASENSQSDRPVLVLLSALLPRVSVVMEHKLASAEKKVRRLDRIFVTFDILIS